MKSNEESLDDLLKSMEDFDINMNIDDDSSAGILDEVYEVPYEATSSFGGLEEDRPLSALEKLMAEMQREEENTKIDKEEEDSLTEENIENLLETASNTEDISDDISEFEVQDDINMAEIEALLNMSDNNEIVEDSEFSVPIEDSIFESAEEEEVEAEVLELDPAELDALLSNDSQPKSEETVLSEAIGDNKKNKPDKVKKEKSEGLFKKVFKILMEEIPDEEPEEASSLNLSEENKDILNELDKEKGKKKKKKEKKPKKGKEENPEQKEGKPKKEKKVKPKKEKKPKKQKEPQKPEKKLPKKKVIVTFVFAFSILAGILLVEMILPPILSKKVAKEAFEEGNYKTAYQEYYGKKLSEEDEMRFQGAKTVMRMQSNLDGYYNYTAINENVMALHSLLEGVRLKSDILTSAELYGVSAQVDKIYQEMLTLLNSEYSLSEEKAIQLTQLESDVLYTEELTLIADGVAFTIEEAEEVENNIDGEATLEVTEEIEENIQESQQEDLLPEEMELIQGGE